LELHHPQKFSTRLWEEGCWNYLLFLGFLAIAFSILCLFKWRKPVFQFSKGVIQIRKEISTQSLKSPLKQVPPPNEAGCLVILLPTKRVYIPWSCSQWFEIPHQSDGCTKICQKRRLHTKFLKNHGNVGSDLIFLGDNSFLRECFAW